MQAVSSLRARCELARARYELAVSALNLAFAFRLEKYRVLVQYFYSSNSMDVSRGGVRGGARSCTSLPVANTVHRDDNAGFTLTLTLTLAARHFP